MLESEAVSWIEYSVHGEPDVDSVNTAVNLARSEHCDFVIGFGGGSVIDTGKAVASLLANSGDLLDYLEVVGGGKMPEKPSNLYIAIPTTSGTGSEVTRNAVISVPDNKVKVSMRSPFLLPNIALIDPEVTFSVPANVTAVTGMDAFIQVIEPYVSVVSNPMVDMFCRDAIPRAANFLPLAVRDGNHAEARINMSWVSLMGGLSLANAKLGAVHGFAGPIGGMFHEAHGAICAALLTGVMRVNIRALQEREPQNKALVRYQEISRWITGDSQASVDNGLAWIENLCGELHIPHLSEMGIERKDFPEIVEKSEKASSMKGNPIVLTKEELTEILEISY